MQRWRRSARLTVGNDGRVEAGEGGGDGGPRHRIVHGRLPLRRREGRVECERVPRARPEPVVRPRRHLRGDSAAWLRRLRQRPAACSGQHADAPRTAGSEVCAASGSTPRGERGEPESAVLTSPGARTVSSSVDTSRASGGLTRTATRTVSGQSADELASDEALDDDRRPREALSTARTTMFGRLSPPRSTLVELYS